MQVGKLSKWLRVKIQYHEPDLPLWVTTYWVFILRYFWNFLKTFFKNIKISHHITILWFTLKKIAKNMSLSKKFKSIYKSFYCLKTLVTMFSKCFWVFFIH